MKVKEMLILARQRLGDMQKTSYSDIELIYCLNNAIDRLSYELYNQNDPELTKKMTLNGTQETKRPDDFISFQGQFPVENFPACDHSGKSPDHVQWDHLTRIRYCIRK